MSATSNEPGWHMRPPQQPYVEELHRENERLRGQVSFLEEENESHRAEKRELEQRLNVTLGMIPQRRDQEDLLLRQLDDTIEKNRRLSDRCAVLEHKCVDFAHLLTASYRLQRSWSLPAVVEVLQEILVNLVGCEQFALFTWEAENPDLHSLLSLGCSTAPKIRATDELVVKALMRQEVVYAEEGGAEAAEELTPAAHIPLCAGTKTVGLVVLYRLLPQKREGLTMLDGELLKLLIWQGGRALQWALQDRTSEGTT